MRFFLFISKANSSCPAFTNSAYSTFRGVMTWSINWDKHDGYNFSVPAKTTLKAMP
jgi:chitinase